MAEVEHLKEQYLPTYLIVSNVMITDLFFEIELLLLSHIACTDESTQPSRKKHATQYECRTHCRADICVARLEYTGADRQVLVQ